jgi:S-adenosyl-L-methionine hydrolase (adenosine-forming)
MTFIALVGSGDRLELSIVGESAAAMLGIPVGAQVELSW